MTSGLSGEGELAVDVETIVAVGAKLMMQLIDEELCVLDWVILI